jgi:hypothetical protein
MVKNNMDQQILETEIETDYARSNQDALLTAGDFTGSQPEKCVQEISDPTKKKGGHHKTGCKIKSFH